MSTKTDNNGIDFDSIKTTMLFYFMAFAALLIALIWILQSFFANNYYERMKAQETRVAAEQIESEYQNNPDSLIENMQRFSIDSGIYIRIDDASGTIIFDNGMPIEATSTRFAEELAVAKNNIDSSNLNALALRTTDQNKIQRIVYVSKLKGAHGQGYMYVIASLMPVRSTISIMRQQLLYISIISLGIAAILAFFISRRLSSPIEDITKMAVELSKGNYDIKFSGGGFTETRELAKTLNSASYEMQKTDFYQKDLIANVSHDLKTPLTMIKSYAEMIDDISGDNPEKRKEHLHVIIQETERLNKLVTDMLSVSRLQSNSVDLNKKKFDIVQAAEEVLETFEILNEQDNYNIMPSLCKITHVFGDEDKIKQVMTNLISNAVKYCGDDKFVKVELKKYGKNKVRFSVVDHGQGIASDEIAHVWDRYYRTSANRDRQIEGTGLGLSIVKGILTLHNANYGVQSKEGEGSDFWFEMDIVKK